MAQSKYKADLQDRSTGETVKDTMFGVNFVVSKNSFGAQSDFADIVSDLGSTAIRYPGGTVTEQYFDPDGHVWRKLFEEGRNQATASDGQVIEGPRKLFSHATENDMGVQFVLPTADLVRTKSGDVVVDEGSVAKVKKLVTDILNGKFGDVDIDQFEIGNEYYFHADLTAEEYGAVARSLVNAVDSAIAAYSKKHDLGSDWGEPSIAVQAGAGWRNGDNETIIEMLGSKALSKVDSVIFHYYPKDLEAVDLKERHLGQIDEWYVATGKADLDFFVSEWNVYSGGDADTGMAQASSIISAFAEMTSRGVDTASIWGAQFRWLDAGLSTNFGGPTLEDTDARLSVSGEIVASMRESLVGLELFDVRDRQLVKGDYDSDDIIVTSYGNDDRAVIYVASRSGQPIDLRIDAKGYFGDLTHIWGETLTSVDDPRTTWANESDPNMVNGLPDFDVLNAGDLKSLTLDPHAILRISIQLDGSGVEMNDHDPITASTINYDDKLVGSTSADRLTAHIGQDTLFGRSGDDSLRAGANDDTIYGGDGDDAIFGDSGDDHLRGGKDRDQIIGGEGDDLIKGDLGHDILIGGAGDDVLFGGDGNDILSGGDGTNTVTGGNGADYFVKSDTGDLIVADVDFAAGDAMTFLGKFANEQDLRAHAAIQGNDLIITDESGQRTIFQNAAGKLDALIASTTDFSQTGRNALELSDMLNDMTKSQIQSYFAQLDAITFFQKFAGADPVVMFSRLEPEVAGHVLNAIESEKLLTLLNLIGDEGLAISLGKFSPAEVVDFFDTTTSDTASKIVSRMGENQAKSLLDGMSRDDRGRLESKLLELEGTKANDPALQAGRYGDDRGQIKAGTSKANDIFGGARNDILTGKGGKDLLKGGKGEDRLYGDRNDDTLSGQTGDDFLSGGSGHDLMIGGKGHDRMKGGTFGDDLYGGRGDDRLAGNTGKDKLVGGTGEDRMWGGSNDDAVFGGYGRDVIFGGTGDDRIFGNAHGDSIFGGRGEDRISGGTGHDTIHGGTRNDRLFGGDGSDEIKGGSGRDYLKGGDDEDRLIGGRGNDTLHGGDGADNLVGNTGDDILRGGKGSDVLDGGKGDDLLAGDKGADLFIFKGQGDDVIADFELGADVLGVASMAFDTVTKDGGTLLEFESGGSVFLKSVALEDFLAEDPVFDLG